MGGWAALDAIKYQEIITGGGDWEPLQAVEPDADMPTINNFGQTILVDFEKKRFRLTFDATRSYPAPGPVKYVEVIDGDVGMLQTTDAEGKVVNERLHPSRLAARLRDTAAAEGGRHDDVADALAAALDGAKKGDRVLGFGSFHTAAAALEWLARD